MPRSETSDSRRRALVVDLNARLRACRKCHRAGFLDERDSVPIVRDPDPDTPLPRILLVGQAPGLAVPRSRTDRSRASPATSSGPGSRKAGIPKTEFYARIHFAAVTRRHPGRLPGARATGSPRRRNRPSAATGSTS